MFRLEAIQWSHFPRAIQLSIGLVLSSLLLAVAYALLAGAPVATPPANSLFAPITLEQTLSTERLSADNSDFVLRPIFSMDRKPAVPVTPVSPPTTIEEPKADASSLQGMTLVGAFSSAGVSGAILNLPGGKRRRVMVGEEVDGWRLDSVEVRTANFIARSGDTLGLSMALSDQQQPLSPRARAVSSEAASPEADSATSRGGAAGVNETDSSANVESEAGQDDPPPEITFGSVYQRRYGVGQPRDKNPPGKAKQERKDK